MTALNDNEKKLEVILESYGYINVLYHTAEWLSEQAEAAANKGNIVQAGRFQLAADDIREVTNTHAQS